MTETVDNQSLLSMLLETRQELAGVRAQLAELQGAQCVASSTVTVVERALSSRRRFLAAGVAVAGAAGLAATGAGALRGAYAAAPTTINYQGRLTDATGTPLNGSYNMTFTLYDAATGGNVQWTETRNGGNAVSVNNGLFSVFLGSITPVPSSILANPLWLGIQIGSDPEMTPREKLGTVPYASTLAGYPPSTSSAANSIPVLNASGRLPANTVDSASMVLGAATNVTMRAMQPGYLTTTSTSWTPINTSTVSLNFTTMGGAVLFVFTACYIICSSGNFSFDFTVDGTQQFPGSSYGIANLATVEAAVPMFITFPAPTLAAGAHTVYPVWKVSSGNGRINLQDTPGYLIAIEFRR